MNPLQHDNVKLFRKHKKYFFAILEKPEGDPLLTSKAYSSKKTRDNGVQTFIKYLGKLEKERADGKFYFTVKAGNNQLIARSADFDSEKKMQTAVDFINRLFALEKIGSAAPKTASAKKKVTVVEPQGQSLDLPPKFTFRMQFYPPNAEEPLRGKIEYPLAKDKQVFEGIDMQTVEAFLRNYLPKEKEKAAKPVLVAERTARSETDLQIGSSKKELVKEQIVTATGTELSRKSPASKKQPGPVGKVKEEVAPPPAIHFEFIDWNTGQPIGSKLSKRRPVGIQVDLAKSGFSGITFPDLMIFVYSIAPESKRKLQLGNELIETKGASLLSVPVDLNVLSDPGAYKIEVLVKFIASNEAVVPFYLLETKMIDLQP